MINSTFEFILFCFLTRGDNGVRLLLDQNFEKIDDCWFMDSYEVVIK